jgi:integrase
MSVRKRVLGSGEVRWLLDYRDQQGKRRARQFKTKKEATDFQIQAGGEIREGVHTPSSTSITVRQACEFWLARAANEGLEAGTRVQYRQHANHIIARIGNLKLSRLSAPDVKAFRDALLKTYSRIMTRKILTSLKGVLKEAMDRGLVNRNVAVGMKVSMPSRHEDKVSIPTRDEIRALLTKSAELWQLSKVVVTRGGERHIVAIPWRPFIVTAIFTGLRLSELRGLTWAAVDLPKGTIKVVQRADFQGTIGSPKSKAGNREVPLAPMVINALKQWKLACPQTPSNLVFPNSRLHIPSTVAVHAQAWRPLLRAIGLVDDKDGTETPRYKFHHLRHAAASLLIDQGLAPKKVQAIMGHGSITMTFDLYGHLFASPEDDAKAMAAIEARLFS